MRTKAATRPPGRPRTNPLPRAEQLRIAKRAQRERDRNAGLVLCQVKLGKRIAERLRSAMTAPGFETEFEAFLEQSVIDARRYPNLLLLCWNRAGRFLTDRDAFGLYERNWRLVDPRNLGQAERALIDRLAGEYCNGVVEG